MGLNIRDLTYSAYFLAGIIRNFLKIIIFGKNYSKMKTLRISISDLEFSKFGLRSNELSFSDFIEIVSGELSKQRLQESLMLAKKYGLSEMTMDEITKEVKAVRKSE